MIEKRPVMVTILSADQTSLKPWNPVVAETLKSGRRWNSEIRGHKYESLSYDIFAFKNSQIFSWLEVTELFGEYQAIRNNLFQRAIETPVL